MAIAIFVASIHARMALHDGLYKVSSKSGVMPEGDYSLLWSTGKMAAAGNADEVYDSQKLWQWRRLRFGEGFFRLDWVYPPPVILLAAVVSFFPLLPGYLAWIAIICGASAWILRRAGLSWPVIGFGLFGPPTWICVIIGQHAPLVAALVVASLLQSRRAPRSSGIQIALATFKPQLGLLVPLLWIRQHRWAALGVGTATSLALAGATTAFFGFAIWPAFLHGAEISGRALLGSFFNFSSHGYPPWAASIFWMARSFGAPDTICYLAQGVAALLACAGTWAAASRFDDVGAAAVAVPLMLLVSPYLYAFDLVAYSIVIAMLAERKNYRFLLFFLWLCPALSELFVVFTGKCVMPACILIVAVLAWQEFGRPQRQASSI